MSPASPGVASGAEPVRDGDPGVDGEPRTAGRSEARPGAAAAPLPSDGPTGETGRTVSLDVIERPGVAPGGVATALVTFDAPAGVDTVGYTVRPVDGVRLYGRADGVVEVVDGRITVPVTFGVPSDAAAGWFTGGTVELSWPGATSAPLEFGTRVEAKRDLTFRLGAETLTVAPGRSVSLPYHLANRGNAADSIEVEILAPGGWIVDGGPRRTLVAPGDSVAGEIRFSAPRRVSLGAGAVVAITARGDGSRVARSVHLVVVAEQGPVGNLAHVPGSVFVGSSTGEGSPSVALTAEGEAYPGVRVDLAIRAMDELAPPPAFREPLGGPRLRLGIGTANWMLALGDVFTRTSAFTGPVLAGRGVDLAWHDEAGRSVEVYAARPISYGYDTEDGRILRAEAGLDTDIGRFSVQASDVERRSDLWQPYGSRALAAGYELRSGTHRVDVNAGIMTVKADTIGSRSGPTIDGRYQYYGDRGRVSMRFRRVPATVQRTASLGNEAFLSSSYEIRPAVTLNGWGFSQESPRLDAPDSRTWGGATGIGLQLAGDARVQLLGTYRATEHENPIVGNSVTRTVRAGLDVPFGDAFSVEMDADVGTMDQDGARPFRMARAGVRWNEIGRWAWVGASYSDFGYGAPSTNIDASTNLRFGGASLFGGLTARVQGPALGHAITFWTGSSIPVTDRTRLALGVDYRPFGSASSLQLSIGVTREFRLPLPMSRQATVRGVVFEDLNGNRRLDADEPVRRGLPIHFGPLRAVTDRDGRFQFYDRVDGSPRVEAGALPPGMVVPADVHIPSSGHVEIPLIRTASVELRVFVDRDGDSTRDSSEVSAEGVTISLQGATGHSREAVSDADGYVRFRGLEPGTYTVQAHPLQADRPSAQPIQVEVEVAPAQNLVRQIALPAYQRPIRIRDGSALSGSGSAG